MRAEKVEEEMRADAWMESIECGVVGKCLDGVEMVVEVVERSSGCPTTLHLAAIEQVRRSGCRAWIEWIKVGLLRLL